jgi:D-sedoheptulose 7-phosphate isomerase
MQAYIRESIAVKERILNDEILISDISHVIEVIKDVYRKGGTLLIAGNGGSAGDAQHFAAEITCQYKETRKGRPAIALHTDTSALTAWGNDKSFDLFFERQVEALGKAGDVLVVISTSGNSKNLLHACTKAREMGITTIGLLGRDGGKLKAEGLCDHSIVVPSHDTPHIQESHIMLIHIMCEALDQFFVTCDAEEVART